MKTEISTVPKIWHWYKNQSRKIKKEFRDKILLMCEIDKSTFYNWLKKVFAPIVALPIISKCSGIPQNDLYKPVIVFP